MAERLRARRAGTPFVLFRDGERRQRIVALGVEPSLVHIGRGPGCEIAEALFLSVETVKSHLHALFDRFEVGDVPQIRKRAELARRAIERGVVPR